jgi:hypothetical protein
MSAPTHEKATEQPTQPLPIPGTENLPPAGSSWLMTPASVLVIPATILTAVVSGELIRDYVLLTDVARSNFAIVALLLVLAFSVTVLILGRLLLREDGKTTSGGGM